MKNISPPPQNENKNKKIHTHKNTKNTPKNGKNKYNKLFHTINLRVNCVKHLIIRKLLHNHDLSAQEVAVITIYQT